VTDARLDEKLSAARARLILERPFLGALVLRLPAQPAGSDVCTTTATDMRRFYFNPEYIEALGMKQLEFVLAHEALHCALAHFTRRGHRDKRRWDLACDLAINPLLVSEGLVPPSNAVTFFEYTGMSAEVIYPLLDENSDESAMDSHLEEPRDSSGSSRSPREGGKTDAGVGESAESLARQWQQHLAAAAQQARMMGKLSGDMMRVVHALLEPKLSWRALLADRMRQSGREDYSYFRPSRREADAILPGLRGTEVFVACVVDVSGSIGDSELREFLAEVDALKAQVNARVLLIVADCQVIGVPFTFEPWDEVAMPKQFPAGGGTDFRPAFRWLDENAIRPDVMIYFTDARGAFPAREPDFPVSWLVKGREPVPWGQRIQLN
jgi:predicted metal-dependent peptidase